MKTLFQKVSNSQIRIFQQSLSLGSEIDGTKQQFFQGISSSEKDR